MRGGLLLETREWRRVVCHAPCTVDLPANGLYVFDGPSMIRSPRFTLPSTADAFRAEVHPGSLARRWVAGVVLAAGSAMLAASLALVGTAAHLDNQYQKERWTLPSEFDPQVIQDRRALGVKLGIASAVAVVGGIVGLVFTRTTVTLVPGTRGPAVSLIPGGIAF